MDVSVKNLVEALQSYQQADEDGIMVFVSRRACDEAAIALIRQTKRVVALEEVLKDVTAHLAAVTSVYQRFCRKGVIGDVLYTTRLKDFKAAIHRVYSTLKESQAPTK